MTNMRRLNVLLVKPFKATDEVLPPLGLGYLATTIRNRHDVSIIDGIKTKMTPEKFKEILKEKTYDIVGIQCYSYDMLLVRDMVRLIKEVSPGTVTVVGGPHPSADTQSVFTGIGADFGFKGESELGFQMLVDRVAGEDIKLEDIPSLIWKDNGEIKVNQQKFIENLDDLKHPSWDLLEPHTYPEAPHGSFFRRPPTAPIFGTRGCPFQCSFCAGFLVSGRKIRYRSIKSIVDEIEMLHKTYGINEIHIEDDNFTLKRQFVVDFCNELKARGLDIAWTCPNGVRLDTLDEELIELMKKSGLYALSVGIESGSERILQDMRKSLTKQKVREKLKMLDKAGLDMVGFFIIGYPGETEQTINETINFACELPLKRASFMIFKPFPGTEATRKIMTELNQETLDWDKFGLHQVVYAPKGMTQERVKQLRQKALIRFYFRPRIILSFFSSLKSFSQSKYVFKRAFKWLVK